MKMTVDSIRRSIQTDLKKAGLWSPQLATQVYCLASAVLALRMSNRDIEGLDSTCGREESKYGSKPVEHPAFRTQRGAMAEVTKQLKILKLTVADLVGTPERTGPIDVLTEKLLAIQ